MTQIDIARKCELAFCQSLKDGGVGTVVLTPDRRLPDKIKSGNIGWLGFQDGYLGLPNGFEQLSPTEKLNADPVAVLLYKMAYDSGKVYQSKA